MDSAPTGTEARVCADIAARQAMGLAKYGTTVADNPLALRAWLQHAYEEALDQAIYLRRAIEQIDDEHNPFSYAPGQEPPRPVHRVVGVCAYCRQPAYVEDPADSSRVACFPCAYSAAN